jgi:hypothetical protein
MHDQMNNWKRTVEAMFGKDFNDRTKAAMKELGVYRRVTRRTNPEPPHWPLPKGDVADSAAGWARSLRLPREMTNDHRAAFTGAYTLRHYFKLHLTYHTPALQIKLPPNKSHRHQQNTPIGFRHCHGDSRALLLHQLAMFN